jgi:hypothetical protein
MNKLLCSAIMIAGIWLFAWAAYAVDARHWYWMPTLATICMSAYWGALWALGLDVDELKRWLRRR